MITEDHISLAIRVANLIGWLIFLTRTLARDVPMSRTARQMIVLVLGFGMTIFVIGGIVPFGLPGSAARFIYTVFTGAAGVAAWTMVLANEGRKKQEKE